MVLIFYKASVYKQLKIILCSPTYKNTNKIIDTKIKYFTTISRRNAQFNDTFVLV